MAVEAPHHAEVATVPGVNRIDHFVIPVNDLWRCYEFYRDILGANAYQFAGFDTERLRRRGNQILFMRIAGHNGVGLSLANVSVPPAIRPFEHVTQGYEVTEAQLSQLRGRLEARDVPYHGPDAFEAPFPVARRLWFQDPDGHTVEACVRRTGSPAASAAASRLDGPVTPLRISHMRIEVTDVRRAARWYQETLGFEPVAECDGETYLQVRSSDQRLILRPTTELSPRRDFVRGPHVDFEASAEQYAALAARIRDREGYFEDAPHPFPNPRGVDHEVTIYFYDPDGNRFQISPHGGH